MKRHGYVRKSLNEPSVISKNFKKTSSDSRIVRYRKALDGVNLCWVRRDPNHFNCMTKEIQSFLLEEALADLDLETIGDEPFNYGS